MATPKIHYINGDVTKPVHLETVICHICNDVNKMGSGVAKALSDKWPIVKVEYHEWANDPNDPNDPIKFELGNTIFVTACNNVIVDKKGNTKRNYIIVANMVAQHRIKSMGEEKPIRYDALDKCLKEVYRFCADNKMILSMPLIGCDRAGGTFEEVRELIIKNILVETFVYVL